MSAADWRWTPGPGLRRYLWHGDEFRGEIRLLPYSDRFIAIATVGVPGKLGSQEETMAALEKHYNLPRLARP